jgi:hypothetical protein
LAGSAGGIDE